MSHKIMIPLLNNEVAPRFDLATDVMLVKVKSGGELSERIIVLPQASADDLCALATSDNTNAVVCGGIDDEHYQYLKWKGIDVLDDVIGPVENVLQAYKDGTLSRGDNFYRK
ncbi:NifB/NifX family molybdenum-iron cluster-binding protein [Maridesulfovibrio sp.]|uniref:NifB/NifX family molybdenum-iron cluster-binding protein n=1 Tax=Maridesulfovibrio sp. TaxID=2795000 RepID=UPI002A18ADD9|nr:NifB/NifX family molybdenum-iron cluster-binding protein [Maridesulfovibrio sp.]